MCDAGGCTPDHLLNDPPRYQDSNPAPSKLRPLSYNTMPPPIEVDIDETLGVGQLSNTTFAQATRIPAEIGETMISKTASIPYLLEQSFQLYIKTPLNILRLTADCLDTLEPSWSTHALETLPIPPKQWLADLEIELRQVWAAGDHVESIIYPECVTIRFPLWIVNYWFAIADGAGSQQVWKAAVTWVIAQDPSPQRTAVIDILETLPWGESMSILPDSDAGSSVSILAEMLSESSWLVERHLNAMAVHLNTEGPTDWYTGPVDLSIHLTSASRLDEDEIRDEGNLEFFARQVDTRKSKHIVFPANTNGNHWIVVYVNLEKKQYTFG